MLGLICCLCVVFVNLGEMVGMTTGRGEKKRGNRTETISHNRKKKTKCTNNTTSKPVLFLSLWLLYAGTFRKVGPSSVKVRVCCEINESMCCGAPCVFISLVSSSNPTCQGAFKHHDRCECAEILTTACAVLCLVFFSLWFLLPIQLASGSAAVIVLRSHEKGMTYGRF